MGICKGVVRTAVITGLVGGAAVLVAGPERVGAILTQTRNSVNGHIDKAIDDPVALRQQLRDLEGQYPKRIADVRGDLAELREQVAQLNRDRDVSARVVELAEADLSTLQPMIQKAEAMGAANSGVYTSSSYAPPVVRIAFGHEQLDLKQAYGRAEQAQQVRAVYSARIGEIDKDLGYLSQQEARMADLVATLETEQAQFQSQLWQLDHQIDAIGRNDRMIEVMQKRQETIEEHSRYRVASLDQLTSRFAEIRSKQEAKLQSLSKAHDRMNYEDRAKIELDARNIQKVPTADFGTPARPSVTVIRPEGQRPAARID